MIVKTFRGVDVPLRQERPWLRVRVVGKLDTFCVSNPHIMSLARDGR